MLGGLEFVVKMASGLRRALSPFEFALGESESRDYRSCFKNRRPGEAVGGIAS